MENELKQGNTVCSFCKSPMEASDIFCQNCGHPENGTDKQRAQFFAKRAMKKNKGIDAENKIQSARNTLFILSGVIALSGFLVYKTTNSLIELGINLFVAFIFLTLAFWSERKPFVALLIGLLLYATLIIVSALIDPVSLVKGGIFKAGIIIFLGKGLYSALENKNND